MNFFVFQFLVPIKCGESIRIKCAITIGTLPRRVRLCLFFFGRINGLKNVTCSHTISFLSVLMKSYCFGLPFKHIQCILPQPETQTQEN